MISVDPTVVPFPISNDAFMQALLGDKWRSGLVAWFPGDPGVPVAGMWTARRASMLPPADQQKRLNTYFCPSLLSGDRRTVSDFVSMHAIVVDDYGTKVPAGQPEAYLGTASWIIETSKDNFQAGWFLADPICDIREARSLLEHLRALLGAGDNLTDPVAWRRLPVGLNAKKAYCNANGEGRAVRLTQWASGRLARDEMKLGAVPVARVRQARVVDAEMPDPGEIEADPSLIAFRRLGMVLGPIRFAPGMGWSYDVRCPWFDVEGRHNNKDDLSGATYTPIAEFFECHHSDCKVEQTMGDVPARLNELLQVAGLPPVRTAAEFDEVEVPQSPFGAAGARGDPDDPVDLWKQRTPPAWPGGVLPARLEATLADAARRGSIDLGALGAAAMTVFSGVADKRSIMRPYHGVPWLVRAILWTMLVGETGMRKTAILFLLLERVRRLHMARMKAWAAAVAAWQRLPPKERGPKPDVAALLAEDTTVEKLQEYMAGQPRGMLYLRDELAGLFDFGRYNAGAGTAERAFFLETNEGGATTVSRMSRFTVIDNSALAMLGGAQPQRLAKFPDLADDGMLSRFATVLMQPGGRAVRSSGVVDLTAIDETVDRLLANGVFDEYRTDAAGEELIRSTQDLGEALTARAETSLGMRGFLRKLHGVHARAALLLHLVDGGDGEVVPVDAVHRAGRYVGFLLGHAEVFYAGLAGSADSIGRAIGSYLLRHPELRRITAGRIRSDVSACRGMKSLREIQDACFVPVMGGWLEPEATGPGNNAWKVRKGLCDMFAERVRLETKAAEAIERAMNQRGRFSKKSTQPV